MKHVFRLNCETRFPPKLWNTFSCLSRKITLFRLTHKTCFPAKTLKTYFPTKNEKMQKFIFPQNCKNTFFRQNREIKFLAKIVCLAAKLWLWNVELCKGATLAYFVGQLKFEFPVCMFWGTCPIKIIERIWKWSLTIHIS